jgi:beta-lactamase superfamily II metal-dependent hydrolase
MNWKQIAAALGVGIVAALQLTVAQAGMSDGKLDIYWADVEGGAATLLVTPAGETLLIDSGNPGTRDPGRIVEVLTKVAGLRKIDHLVVTHYHGDHFGGAATLAKLVPIGTVYDNGEWAEQTEKPDPSYREFPCDKRVVIHPGDKLPLKSGDQTPLVVACLGARQKFIAAPATAAENPTLCATARSKNRDGSDNANSVVLLVSFGPFKFFDGGDLTWNVEQKLVCPKNLVGLVDVYQVTHHGLDASNNPLVLQALQPKVAIMNNGKTKGCMPEVFENLKNTKSLEAVYQLHKNERPDGDKANVPSEFIANVGKEVKGNYLKLSVAPDGKSYTVSIPASGHTQTYQTRNP